MRLLIAEDDRELSNALCAILKFNKYSLCAVYDGQDALDYALTGIYDGIILDVMMPKLDGIEVVRRLRGSGVTVPVLLLTAKSEIEDRVAGLDSGADDYLTKPFSTEELLARIRAMTRRNNEFSPDVITLGNITLNRSNYELSGGSASFRLGNKEFQIIEMLFRNPNRLISSEQIIERIWGLDSDVGSNVVWVYISYLRKKLTALGANVHIKASRGIGYIMESSD